MRVLRLQNCDIVGGDVVVVGGDVVVVGGDVVVVDGDGVGLLLMLFLLCHVQILLKLPSINV